MWTCYVKVGKLDNRETFSGKSRWDTMCTGAGDASTGSLDRHCDRN